ncbi:pseudouridine synthase [Candidatus Palauibacter sp.]|uniref:pseudouridine synthase n=1 Tax=Candidatus Palauibacter sp. TaxID=3101350 RepID=UPI003B012E9F
MRLQKFLAGAGVASRRACEELIASGRVRVNGRVVTTPGTRVEPESARVEVDGRRVELKPVRWVALHKPPGYGCTRRDPAGRPTIYDLLPSDAHHLPHVGRLDFMSEGLILLSNEGDLANRLLHPSAEVARTYVVELVGSAPADLPVRLEAGVTLTDGPARARGARWVRGSGGTRSATIEIILSEGRNREIRRMLARFEVPIRRLRRTSFGPIELGALAAGESRDLSSGERAALARAACSRASRK